MSGQAATAIDLRTVEAAEASVLQAERAVDLSIASIALSLVALIALLITIVQGRIALKKAQIANNIAADSSQNQLRAYLSVEPFGVQVPGKGWISVPLNLFNHGATPASDIEVTGDVLVIDGNPREFDPK